MDLNFLTIKEAQNLMEKGEISSLDLTLACLKEIERNNPTINAVLSLDEKGAKQAAILADKERKKGKTGSLLGIPYLVKDIILTKGLKTTAASKILENYISPFDATVIQKLKKAGAILLGKTNLDEFAHGASTENSAYGASKNPYDIERTPGGSSGGSAAALTSGMCLFSLGSDTGGSIRQPASFCNLVGLKPSYGRVSRFGLLSMTSSTDVIGPFTRTIEDASLVLQTIAGPDNYDANCLRENFNYNSNYLSKGVKHLRVAWPKQFFNKNLDPQINQMIKEVADKLTLLGAEIVPVNFKYINYSVPVYYIITPSEISSNLARFDGLAWGMRAKQVKNIEELYLNSRGQGFGAEVKRRIMLGTFALSSGYADKYYKKAQGVRQLIKQEFSDIFKKVDLILSPTSVHGAFKLGQQTNNPLAMYLEDIYLAGASLAGLPALSMPAGFIKETGQNPLPAGLQLIAPYGKEEKLFQVASSIEKGRYFYQERPIFYKNKNYVQN
jgi:aspartyl-tRNA(Asn)/glutamyl-tRNA(Gln) amidotransferase subunit A